MFLISYVPKILKCYLSLRFLLNTYDTLAITMFAETKMQFRLQKRDSDHVLDNISVVIHFQDKVKLSKE